MIVLQEINKVYGKQSVLNNHRHCKLKQRRSQLGGAVHFCETSAVTYVNCARFYLFSIFVVYIY